MVAIYIIMLALPAREACTYSILSVITILSPSLREQSKPTGGSWDLYVDTE